MLFEGLAIELQLATSSRDNSSRDFLFICNTFSFLKKSKKVFSFGKINGIC